MDFPTNKAVDFGEYGLSGLPTNRSFQPGKDFNAVGHKLGTTQ